MVSSAAVHSEGFQHLECLWELKPYSIQKLGRVLTFHFAATFLFCKVFAVGCTFRDIIFFIENTGCKCHGVR